jgi:2-(1,2-epoxy-1,2-dihydrophenyl)acetyl-CoA isomerase
MADVELEKHEDGVGLITLNRPESLNAMGGELIPLLGAALEECERDRRVRCVALTGAGRGFCAGGDVKGFAARATKADDSGGDGGAAEAPSFSKLLEDTVRGLQSSQNQVSLRLHTMPKPTVALVNGAAAGAGMSVALACDLRICSDKAVFVPAFAKVGLSGDFGGTYFLQRLVGPGRARELYFLSDRIPAARALELGIANRVVAHDTLLDEGLAFCSQLAKGPTSVYARMKANFVIGESSTFADALNHEALNMRLSGLGRDHREGARSFVEKREPNFTGE